MVGFSTGNANLSSWSIGVSSGVATLSFSNNEIDVSDPSPDAILNDAIELPDMTLGNISSEQFDPDGAGPIPAITVVVAVLTPVQGQLLTVIADSGPQVGNTVMEATVKTGGFLTVSNNFIAYSLIMDDLDVVSSVSGYSDVIDSLAMLDADGYKLDLSFSGDTTGGGGLVSLLTSMQDGSVDGTLSGQIFAIPEPMTLALLGMGGLALIRRKR
ncbi:MAG: PEP-CTERM sorting domain-containing protein [Sedimentisphaerales bacterium]|nr:PEP-CTERM sorting domain-containing protein [Sedimentisphaerales bacterium]